MKIDIVVKVGGSLYDLPELGPRLGDWLAGLKTTNVLLIPGGGRTADLVRGWDQQHKLGEESSHWLALRALTFNAHYLATLLRGSCVVQDLNETPPGLPILDMHAWAKKNDHLPERFPQRWDVTSDSLAVQVAIVGNASQVILLKSVPQPEGMNWREAARRGLVDSFFPQAVTLAPVDLKIRMVRFR
jgi:aspartokinase-like uncharacterized kinase